MLHRLRLSVVHYSVHCSAIAVLAAASISSGVSVRAQTPATAATPPPAQLQKQTLAGIDKLQSWYTQSTGLYQTTGWWNSANALTMLADYSLVVHSNSYTTVFSNSFQQAQKTNSGFLNNYYDDEGWWALAWVAAYDLTHTQQYLDMAASIFTDMSGGWDSTCGGGIWWSKDKTYKNAIANELFLSVAAHLANRVAPADRAGYLNWANKEWAWFQQSGMINSQNLINDGWTSPPAKTTDRTPGATTRA